MKTKDKNQLNLFDAPKVDNKKYDKLGRELEKDLLDRLMGKRVSKR